MRGIAPRILLLVLCAAPAFGEEQHLRFFAANRDWLLRAFEALPKNAPAPGDAARAWSFDPFADASALAAIRAAGASLDSAATLADLDAFRTSLDSLLAAASASAARLDDLDRRFAAHLRTVLEVTLAAPEGLAIERVEATLEGTTVQQHVLDPSERAALAAGGVLEVLRRVVEPRAQDVEVRVWTAGAAEPSCTRFTVEPPPDVLSICHLDLESSAKPARLVRTALGGAQ
jgi:hypothetical protein